MNAVPIVEKLQERMRTAFPSLKCLQCGAVHMYFCFHFNFMQKFRFQYQFESKSPENNFGPSVKLSDKKIQNCRQNPNGCQFPPFCRITPQLFYYGT